MYWSSLKSSGVMPWRNTVTVVEAGQKPWIMDVFQIEEGHFGDLFDVLLVI